MPKSPINPAGSVRPADEQPENSLDLINIDIEHIQQEKKKYYCSY